MVTVSAQSFWTEHTMPKPLVEVAISDLNIR